MSLWQRYTTIQPRTRLLVGVGVMCYATFALYATDTAEESFGLKATEADREELRKLVPKVRVVERVEEDGGVGGLGKVDV